ncbi:hypothetical protein ACHAPT_000619 [Fusarium lateritium]
MQAQPNAESPTSRRLSHIDGLIAGFNVSASDCRLARQKKQWDQLDELRTEMRYQWDGPLADIPLHVVDNLEGFCDTAFFAYRNTLAGLVPTDLPKIVGLCSLSYAVSRILEREGTPFPENFLEDIQICLQSLERQEDRQMIEAAMRKLWPATGQIDQTSHAGGDSLVPHQPQDWTYCHASSAYPSAASSQPWQVQDAPSLPYTSTGSQFGALAGGLPVAANWAHTPQHHFESLPPESNSADYMALNLIPYGGINLMPDTSWSGADKVEFQAESLGQAKSLPSAASPAPSGPQHVQDTGLFKTIGAFLDGLSDFLTILSGNGITAKNLGSCLSSHQERLEDKEQLLSSYLEPLLKRRYLSQPPCPAIISIARKFVAYGFLQSIEEVQSYMKTLAEELLHDEAEQEKFCQSIMCLPKAFECLECGHGFTRKSNMTRHQRQFHRPDGQDDSWAV